MKRTMGACPKCGVEDVTMPYHASIQPSYSGGLPWFDANGTWRWEQLKDDTLLACANGHEFMKRDIKIVETDV